MKNMRKIKGYPLRMSELDWWLIVIVLVIDCLLFSVVIEFLKEVLRYNHLTIKIEKKLHGMISNE